MGSLMYFLYVQELFNEEFYSHVDEEKPQFSDMEDDEFVKDANKLGYDECGKELHTLLFLLCIAFFL